MTLYIKKHIARDYVKQNLETIFLLESHMWPPHYGQQSVEFRNEVNVFGVPTKWSPFTGEAAYFTDSDLPKVQKFLDFPFDVAIAWLQAGRDVCIPADGFGTGLAQLEKRAPVVKSYIDLNMARLYNVTNIKKEIH